MLACPSASDKKTMGPPSNLKRPFRHSVIISQVLIGDTQISLRALESALLIRREHRRGSKMDQTRMWVSSNNFINEERPTLLDRLQVK